MFFVPVDDRGKGSNWHGNGNRSHPIIPHHKALQSTSLRQNLNYTKTSSSSSSSKASSSKGAAAASTSIKVAIAKPIIEKKKKGNTQYDLLFHQPVDCLNANNCQFVQRFENVHTAATTHKVLASDLQFAIQCGNSCRGFLWKYTPNATNGSSSSTTASASRNNAKPAATNKATTYATQSSSSSSSSSAAAATAKKKKDYLAATAKLGKSSSAGARGGSSSSAGGGSSRNHNSSGAGSSNSSSSKNGSQPRYQTAMKQPRNIAAHIAATLHTSASVRASGSKRPSPSQTYYEGKSIHGN